MNTTNQNVSNIQQILDIMQEVVLLCFYKGFPITCKAYYQGTRDNLIVFKVNPPGSICLSHTKSAWILGDELFDAFKVTITSFEIATGILLVSEPTWAGIKFGNRKVARVEPREVIPVSITIEESGEKAKGTISDISLGGAGILLNDGESLAFSPGEAISLKIKFPKEFSDRMIDITGKIISRGRLPIAGTPSQIRFSVSFTSSMLAKTPILLYIARRRAQLMQEIQQLYDQELQKKQSS